MSITNDSQTGIMGTGTSVRPGGTDYAEKTAGVIVPRFDGGEAKVIGRYTLKS